jgi:hypothetical protein
MHPGPPPYRASPVASPDQTRTRIIARASRIRCNSEIQVPQAGHCRETPVMSSKRGYGGIAAGTMRAMSTLRSFGRQALAALVGCRVQIG